MAYKTVRDPQHYYYSTRWNRLPEDKADSGSNWKTQNMSEGNYFAGKPKVDNRDMADVWRSSGRACCTQRQPIVARGKIDLSLNSPVPKEPDRTLRLKRSEYYEDKNYPK